MIIAIDFDGTICAYKWPEIGEPLPGALETIRDLHSAGHRLILWTCREGKKLQEATLHLNEHGIAHCFVAVNENDPIAKSTFNNDCRKIGADLYIDDKGVGWQGWGAVREYFGFKNRESDH